MRRVQDLLDCFLIDFFENFAEWVLYIPFQPLSPLCASMNKFIWTIFKWKYFLTDVNFVEWFTLNHQTNVV